MAVARQESVRNTEERPGTRRSGGPRTAAGKARSARNAWKHGLRARKVLVCGEDAGQYGAFRARMFGKWVPRDDDEAFLVHRMSGAMWRLLRCPEVEAELLDTLRDEDAPGGGLARAFLPDGTADGAAIVRFARYETALERSYFRCLKMLRLLRLVDGAGIEHVDTPSGGGGPAVTEDWAETAETAEGIAPPKDGSWDDEPPDVVRVILDDERVEVEEVILDEEEDPTSPPPFGHPLSASGEGEGPAAHPTPSPSPLGGEGEAPHPPDPLLRGEKGEEECPPGRPKADKFPNELGGAAHAEREAGRSGDGPPPHVRGDGGGQGAEPGRAASPSPGGEGQPAAARDWPGEPDYKPVKREPIRYSEFGARSVFADDFER